MNRFYRIQNGARKANIHRHLVHPVNPVNPVKIRFLFQRCRSANTPPAKRKYLRKSQLWSRDFTAKLVCNVEFWIERLPKLIEHQPEFERPVAAGGSLLPRRRPSD